MKSVKSDKPCEPKTTYPCLMISKVTGNVLIMTTDRKGTIVYLGNTMGRPVGTLGEYAFNWIVDNLTPYNGSVCLEN